MASLFEQILKRTEQAHYPEVTEGEFDVGVAREEAREQVGREPRFVPRVQVEFWTPETPEPPTVTPEDRPTERPKEEPEPERPDKPRPEVRIPSILREPEEEREKPRTRIVERILRPIEEQKNILNRTLGPTDPEVEQAPADVLTIVDTSPVDHLTHQAQESDAEEWELNRVAAWLNNKAKNYLKGKAADRIMKGKPAFEDDVRIFSVAPGSTNPVTGKTMEWYNMQRMFIEDPDGNIVPYDDLGYWGANLASKFEMGARAAAGLGAQANAWVADRFGLEGYARGLRDLADDLYDPKLGIISPYVEEKREARAYALSGVATKYRLLETAIDTTLDIVALKAGMKALGVSTGIPTTKGLATPRQWKFIQGMKGAGTKADKWSTHVGGFLKSEKTHRWMYQMSKMGPYGFATVPSPDMKDRWQRMRMLMIYNSTPYISAWLGGFLPAKMIQGLPEGVRRGGLPVFLVDSLLNTAITSPTYAAMAEEVGWFSDEWWEQALPNMILDIYFAWDTRKWPTEARPEKLNKRADERANFEWKKDPDKWRKRGYTQEKLRESYRDTFREYVKAEEEGPAKFAYIMLRSQPGMKDFKLTEDTRIDGKALQTLNEHFGVDIRTDSPVAYLRDLHERGIRPQDDQTVMLKTAQQIRYEQEIEHMKLSEADRGLIDVAKGYKDSTKFIRDQIPHLERMQEVFNWMKTVTPRGKKTLNQTISDDFRTQRMPDDAWHALRDLGFSEFSARDVNRFTELYMEQADRMLLLRSIFNRAHQGELPTREDNREHLKQEFIKDVKKVDPTINPEHMARTRKNWLREKQALVAKQEQYARKDKWTERGRLLDDIVIGEYKLEPPPELGAWRTGSKAQWESALGSDLYNRVFASKGQGQDTIGNTAHRLGMTNDPFNQLKDNLMSMYRARQAMDKKSAEVADLGRELRAQTTRELAANRQVLDERTRAATPDDNRWLLRDLERGETDLWRDVTSYDGALYRVTGGRFIDMQTSDYAQIREYAQKNEGALREGLISRETYDKNRTTIQSWEMKFAEAKGIAILRDPKTGKYQGLAIDKYGNYASKEWMEEPLNNWDSHIASLTNLSLNVGGVPRTAGRFSVTMNDINLPAREAIASVDGTGGFRDAASARVNKDIKELGIFPSKDGKIVSDLIEFAAEFHHPRVTKTAQELRDKYVGMAFAKGAETKHWEGALRLHRTFSDLREQVNPILTSLGLEPIPYRGNYIPHLQRAGVWSRHKGKELRQQDMQEGESWHMASKRVNPRAWERTQREIRENPERNVYKLFDSWTGTVGKSIYYTMALRKANIAIKALENRSAQEKAKGREGYDKAIRGFKRHIREGLLERPSHIDDFLKVLPGTQRKKVADKITSMRIHGSLVGKLSWNLFTQPSSSALTAKEVAAMQDLYKGAAAWFAAQGDLATERSQVMRIKQAGKKAHMVSGMLDRADYRVYFSPVTKLNDFMSIPMRAIERHLTGWSYMAGAFKGEKLGYKGKDLATFADVVAERSQSMYNRGSRPTILNSSVVRALFPFQSYSMEMYGHLRELAGMPAAWQVDQRMRVGQAFHLIAGIALWNWINRRMRGSYVYSPGTAVPFIGTHLDRQIERGLGLPRGTLRGREEIFAVQGDWDRMMNAVSDVKELGRHVQFHPDRDISALARAAAEYAADPDNFSNFRRELIYYTMGLAGLGGAGQANATVDGLIASARGYVYDGMSKRLQIENWEKFVATVFGPWTTRTAIEYRKELEELDTSKRLQDQMREDIYLEGSQMYDLLLKMAAEGEKAEAKIAWRDIQENRPMLAHAMDQIQSEHERGLTVVEKRIDRLHVYNWQRAQKVAEYLIAQPTAQDAQRLYREWKRKRIITDTIAEQVSYLLERHEESLRAQE